MTEQQPRPPLVDPGAADRAVPRTPWWKHPIIWIVSVVLIGLAAQLQATIQAYVKAILATVGITEPGAPVEVLDVYLNRTGAEFVLPGGVSDQELASWDRSDRPGVEWLDAHGAVPVDNATWEITLVGRRADAVAITDMRPVLEGGRCAAPIGGALIEGRAEGGPTELITLSTEADSSVPVLKSRDENGTRPFFADNNLSLPAGEKNTLLIKTTTTGPYCRWTLEVEYLADGDRQKMTITAPGEKAFAVTGDIDPAQYESAFLSPDRPCGEPYMEISGSKYAEISSEGPLSCPAG